jgi:hypothetical protein
MDDINTQKGEQCLNVKIWLEGVLQANISLDSIAALRTLICSKSRIALR